MLVLLTTCTIPHYTKRPHFKYMLLIRDHIIIPESPRLPYTLLPGGSYHFAFHYISFQPPLGQNPERNLAAFQ